jgi:hypothetical protein
MVVIGLVLFAAAAAAAMLIIQNRGDGLVEVRAVGHSWLWPEHRIVTVGLAIGLFGLVGVALMRHGAARRAGAGSDVSMQSSLPRTSVYANSTTLMLCRSSWTNPRTTASPMASRSRGHRADHPRPSAAAGRPSHRPLRRHRGRGRLCVCSMVLSPAATWVRR